MENNYSSGWHKMMENYPWFRCDRCFPLPAYSEFMPSPMVGRKPLGEVDNVLFREADPFGWYLTEIEEEYELRPGMIHTGNQIMEHIINLGKGLPEHHITGHNGANLKGNPYWPPDLASKAGTLYHERFVTLLPMMLSRTQDDKGRIIWTLFGKSTSDPETAFWKNFYRDPDSEIPAGEAISFFTMLLSKAYNENLFDSKSLFDAGFRILDPDKILPQWTKPFILKENSSFDKIRYLLTFRPFGSLPPVIREKYLQGSLSLLPFPGSLVFWGMPGFEKLSKQLPPAGQIPLLRLVSRNIGLNGIRVAQSGWFYETRPGREFSGNKELVHDTFHRTHRWQRLHKYQDELNEEGNKTNMIKVLFSTDPEAIGLYDKPLARNSHIWNEQFDLVLDGPNAERHQILEAEKSILEGGLFGYRFFYPPMRVGEYEVYLHRPLIAFLPSGAEKPEIITDALAGFLTCFHRNDMEMANPVEMWPRPLRRDLYLQAIKDFNNEKYDYYTHQTPLNIISLLDAWMMQNKEALQRSYAHRLLTIAKNKDLKTWLDELPIHSASKEAAEKMMNSLSEIIEPENNVSLPESLTFSDTATREFEVNWWNDIRYLAHGKFNNKDNADIASDSATISILHDQKRDLEQLGDYLIERHRKSISETGMYGQAICGEMPFKWKTDFEYSLFGGWNRNQKNEAYERNIIVMIPGKDRKEAVIFGDHYDTAYMEDIYDKGSGGSGARLSARGADDNYSATSALLQAAPIFLKMAKEGRLERDIWLIHLTGEEFPSDCMGARYLCRSIIEGNLPVKTDNEKEINISGTRIAGVYIMDMIGHNRDDDQNVFQISPGKSASSLYIARQAHISNQIWNNKVPLWNQNPERKDREKGKRISGDETIPETARFLQINGEVRTKYNPESSIFNTDGQIFSDVGLPVVLFMENYDISRTGYHDTRDTLENIDLDYGAAFAAIAIETVARLATDPKPGFK